MNELKIKLSGSYNNEIILVDGEQVKSKKNKYGSSEFVFLTEKTKVEVCVLRCLEITRKHWWLWQMLYFFVSIFGIFDIQPDKKCVVIDCKYLVNLNEKTEMQIAIDNTQKPPKLKVESNTEFEEIKNSCFVDNQAKKRYKKLKIFKIIFWILLVLATISMLLIKLL